MEYRRVTLGAQPAYKTNPCVVLSDAAAIPNTPWPKQHMCFHLTPRVICATRLIESGSHVHCTVRTYRKAWCVEDVVCMDTELLSGSARLAVARKLTAS